MSKYEQEYLDLCRKIKNTGVTVHNERTGQNCLTIPKYSFEYTEHEMPLLSVRPSYPVSAWAEMVGYLRRYEWATQFADIGAFTWGVNANETKAWLNNPHRKGHNHLGKVYGAALADWELPELFQKLRDHNDDRGLIINFWRPEKFDFACLRPCMYQHVFTILDGKLYLESTQRSCDVMCGLNFNSLQVWMLLKFCCHITGLEFGGATHNITNLHIYEPHLEGLDELLSRAPHELNTEFKISDWVNSFRDIAYLDLHARDYFELVGYESQPRIQFELIA